MAAFRPDCIPHRPAKRKTGRVPVRLDKRGGEEHSGERHETPAALVGGVGCLHDDGVRGDGAAVSSAGGAVGDL